MAPACHRIGALQIELRLEEESQSRPLMDRLAALREPRLEGVLQRVLDELSPAGRRDRFELVELDLGPLPLSGFDDAFLARLEPALRQALARQLQGRPAEAPVCPVLELLRVYAITGNLPWWADRDERGLIGAQIRRALELAPETWWALLQELQASATAIERLAAACDEATLAALLDALLVDGNAPIAAFEGTGSLPQEATADLRSVVGSLAGRGRLLRLAARGVSGENLRSALLHGETDGPERPQQGIAPSAPSATEGLPTNVALLSPWPQGTQPPETTDDAAARLPGGNDLGPGINGVAGLSGDEGSELPPERLARLPEPLRSLVAQGLRGEALRRALAARLPGVDPLAPGPRPVVPPGRDFDPADPDELAIEDGGLVILWPFLDTLLSRLEFVDPERKVFTGEEARNQAIALLSFLVEGEADPPEWRLALAKVLCGLSPLAPWQLEESLKPEALAEGERLLEAVIAHGGMAEELAVEDLRGLILRRPAVLTSRAGAWLLRVERRPEDGLLDRFPWGWSWIRLPWMEHPLQVEW